MARPENKKTHHVEIIADEHKRQVAREAAILNGPQTPRTPYLRELVAHRKTFTLDTELKARQLMDMLKRSDINYSYWHRSVCEHIVTIKS